jgi:aryl-alcohol dehydrogenase-like predicted oxidoreductase
MGLTAFYGVALEDERAMEVLQKAFELGVTHFDTAEMYQGKDAEGNHKYNEEIVGKFAAQVGRDKVTVATKYFPTPEKVTCTPEMVRSSLEASLQRLGMDCVDLYYLHRIPSDEGLKSWMDTAKELVREGKCKYLGLSEATPAQIRAAHEIHPLSAVQQEWSMVVRNLEADVVPTCRELGIGIVAYSPLCRGFTSSIVKTAGDWSKIGNEGGAATGFQAMCPHLTGDNLVENAKLLAPLEAKAAEMSVTPAQLSLAWVQNQGADVFPIPGTTKVANLEANVNAAKLALELPPGITEALGAEVDWTKVQGDRYPEAFMGLCYEKKG